MPIEKIFVSSTKEKHETKNIKVSNQKSGTYSHTLVLDIYYMLMIMFHFLKKGGANFVRIKNL